MRITICGISMSALFACALFCLPAVSQIHEQPSANKIADQPANKTAERAAERAVTMQAAAAAVVRDPKDPQARYALAMELSKHGFRALAVEHLDEAERLHPQFALNLFHTLVKQHNTQAIADLLFYVQLRYPNHPLVLEATAQTLLKGGYPKLAQALLDKAATLSAAAPHGKGSPADIGSPVAALYPATNGAPVADASQSAAATDAGMFYFRTARNLDQHYQRPELALIYYKQALQLRPHDPAIALASSRAAARMQIRKRDIAWQLKSFLWRNVNK